MASLIDVVKDKFLEAIRSVNPPGKWKLLVIDEHAQKLLAAVLKNNDVLQENVTLIESMASYRQPQSIEAMYILMPTAKNVDRIVADFSGAEPLYQGAHLFFVDPLPEPLFNRLVNSPAEPHLKRLSDLYLNYNALEAQAFTLPMPHHFFSFYCPPPGAGAVATCRARIDEDLMWTAKGLLNVLVSLGENPLIRYYIPDHPPLGALADQAVPAQKPSNEPGNRWRGALASATMSWSDGPSDGDHVTKRLAFLLQKELDEYAKNNPDFVKTSAPNKPKPVFFITDRTMDLAAPFVHEFTYQAMVNDLLPIENGTRYRYKFQSSAGTYEDQTATLSDADTIWTKIRHLHMQDSITTLMGDFNKFMEENAGFTGNGTASINDMKDMLAGLPQFKEQREKFSLHLNMAQESMDIYAKKHLEAVAQVEQCCATGKDARGKTPKTLVEDMVPLLADPALTSRDKVRIIALYILFKQGIPEEDKRRLFEHARLTLAEQDAINSLSILGARILRTPADRDMRTMKQRPAEDDYELSRFQPILKTMLLDHISNELDQNQFPYVRNAPGPSVTPAASPAPQTSSLRSARPGWTKAAKPMGAKTKEAKQRMFVFVIGGMTYSEMRTAYRISESSNKEIFIGSSHIYTPVQYIDDLKALEHGGVGSKALPNGLRVAEARPFLAAYDEKYYTADPPPPPQPQPQAAPAPRQARPGPAPAQSPLPSPMQSLTSVKSHHSGFLHRGSDAGSDKDKKKKGFFGRF